MPGHHVTDHQMRLFMQHRQTDTVAVAAAKASMSRATGHRIAKKARLPSTSKVPRGPARARTKIGLANLAYNLNRFIWIETRSATA